MIAERFFYIFSYIKSNITFKKILRCRLKFFFALYLMSDLSPSGKFHFLFTFEKL